MAKCQWCDKELPNEGANVCGSCVFKSVDELLDESGNAAPEKVDANYDLAQLAERKITKRKRAAQLNTKLLQKSMVQDTDAIQEIPMRKVTVKSNSIRGRTFVVDGELVLSFDKDGFAECLASDVPRITAYNRVRPGRLTVVREEVEAAPAPAPEPAPVVEEVVVEEEPVVEETVEEVVVEETEESEPKVKAKPRKKPARKRKPKAEREDDEEDKED